jgi:hypothetical protein
MVVDAAVRVLLLKVLRMVSGLLVVSIFTNEMINIHRAHPGRFMSRRFMSCLARIKRGLHPTAKLLIRTRQRTIQRRLTPIHGLQARAQRLSRRRPMARPVPLLPLPRLRIPPRALPRLWSLPGSAQDGRHLGRLGVECPFLDEALAFPLGALGVV